MHINWARRSSVSRLLAVTAAGATSVNTNSVQIGGAQNICFLISFGGTVTVAGGTPLYKVQQSDDNSTFTDVPNASVNIVAGMANKEMRIDLIAPKHAYYRLVIDRTGNAGNNIAVDAVYAQVYFDRVQPTPLALGTEQASPLVMIEA